MHLSTHLLHSYVWMQSRWGPIQAETMFDSVRGHKSGCSLLAFPVLDVSPVQMVVVMHLKLFGGEKKHQKDNIVVILVYL